MSKESGPPKGKFIVVEGGEGAGKTSALRVVEAYFKASRKDDVKFFREPGSTLVGDEVRRLLLDPMFDMNAFTEFLLFWVARSENVSENILPPLMAGKHVVCDRYDSSTYAYQIVARQRTDLTALFNTIRLVCCKDALPDLYIYLDLDPEVGLRRVDLRGDANRLDREKLDFHHRARAGYHEFFASHPHEIVDASRSQAEVANDVLQIVRKALE